jgi:hypothetical protein
MCVPLDFWRTLRNSKNALLQIVQECELADNRIGAA